MKYLLGDVEHDPGHAVRSGDATGDASPVSPFTRDEFGAGPRAEAVAAGRRSAGEGRHRTQRFAQLRRPVASIAGHRAGPDHTIDQDQRAARMRLVAWLFVGVALLMVARWFQPEQGSLFSGPPTLTAWVSLVCGFAGMWLVPGQWLSALAVRTGAGLTAWLVTRIGTTLAWYALVGPIIHQQGQGARVTTDGILIATIGASAAIALGLLLGMVRRPARPWVRILAPAVIGAVTAQVVISVTMRVWTYDMNYSHIERLNWQIVFCCAALATLAALTRPKMPPARTAQNMRVVLVSLAVVAVTAGVLAIADTAWPPEQRMPSAFSIEQVPTPDGADVAFAVAAIGPDGPQLISQARFTASDETGRPIPVQTRWEGGQGGAAENRTLLVALPPTGELPPCRADRSPKITVRDEVSGVRVQAVLPDGRCVP